MFFNKVTRLFPLCMVIVAVVAIVSPTMVMANGVGSLFVADKESGNIYVVDPVTKTTVAAIGLPGHSHGMAFAPDSKTVYVANTGDKSLTIIDTVSESMSEAISTGSAPVHVALSPNLRHVYVVDEERAELDQVDLETHQVAQSLSLGGKPHGIAISSNGRYVYVANPGSNSVNVVDTVSWRQAATIAVDGGPSHIVLAGSLNKAYVSATDASALVVIDTLNNTVESRKSVDSKPGSLAITPTGRYVYAVHEGGSTASVLDTSTGTVAKISLPVPCTSVAMSPDGVQAYLSASQSKAILILDIASQSIIDSVTIPGHPGELVMSPILAPVQTQSGPPLTVPAKLPRTGDGLLTEAGNQGPAQQSSSTLIPTGTALILDVLMLICVSLVIARRFRHS